MLELQDRDRQCEPDVGLWTGCVEIALGMPHLALKGLSEAWVLKELGHLHWTLLARMAKRKFPDFQDAAGNVVYAAFRSVEVEGARFGLACENDILRITSTQCRISRTQIQSRHTLTINNEDDDAGIVIGVVTMVSVFVHRTNHTSNRSIARVEVQGLPPITGHQLAPRHNWFDDNNLFTATEGNNRQVQSFLPCPSQDFNGAGFLYFANFSAFVDRAELNLDPTFSRQAVTSQRHIKYHSNVDPGEPIRVEIMDLERSSSNWLHRCRISREKDGALMADIITEKCIPEAIGPRRTSPSPRNTA
ncbi:Pnap_2097 family protein [Thalassospira marina]|uniref:Biosynthetic protein, Pnap_2097 family n=1 Tax=Thalassospira marina TaxID=2048283 RepID=A0A2N3KTG9_9PROT|nr:Pnap_2097 family protein [Thalassospira marina]PKR53858.1 hypothetical protein COO20_12685 [Thalassospira marina]